MVAGCAAVVVVDEDVDGGVGASVVDVVVMDVDVLACPVQADATSKAAIAPIRIELADSWSLPMWRATYTIGCERTPV